MATFNPNRPMWEGEVKGLYVHAWYEIQDVIPVAMGTNRSEVSCSHLIAFDDDGKEIKVKDEFYNLVADAIEEEMNYR